MKPRCSSAGAPIRDIGDGVVDNGEWISWESINRHVRDEEEEELLERMIEIARDYHDLTGRHLPILGEIGELYAERCFGIERHREYAQGSDGKIGDTFVEIKTITPGKGNDVVRVKRSGNFGALVIVKINEEFELDARIIKRSQLPKGNGKHMKVSWKKAAPDFAEA